MASIGAGSMMKGHPIKMEVDLDRPNLMPTAAVSRPESVLKLVEPDVTFNERIAAARAVHKERVNARVKELNEKKEALLKKQQELLLKKNRMEAEIVELKTRHQVVKEATAEKLKELKARKNELKQEKSRLKAEKTVISEDNRVLRRMFSGFKKDLDEFAAEHGGNHAVAESDFAETSASSD